MRIEKESTVGGCAAGFEKFGYQFEQTYGLYTGWDQGEIHDRIFAELNISPPLVNRLDSAYTVRLPDDSEIQISGNDAAFETSLRSVFPECADAAISFYRELTKVSAAYDDAVKRSADSFVAIRAPQRFSFFGKDKGQEMLWRANQGLAVDELANTSFRFRRFIDIQLQTLCQAPASQTSYLYAALALTATRGKMFGISGGAASLANVLADSIRKSGGRIRLDTSVLRLAYDSGGEAVGVDLLTGETVTASRAIISNLTVWDTYGKLVGLNRTPTAIRKELKSKRGWGAYLMYLGWDQANAEALNADRWLCLNDWQEGTDYDPQNQFFFNAAPSWDSRGPDGKRAVTVHTFTDVDDWFTFHTDESELEDEDQQQLEAGWKRLHDALPQLGDSIEVIDTATPRSFYEQTRRKLGMVGSLPFGPGDWPAEPPIRTTIPNLFLISDTTSPGGIAGLSQSALALANHLMRSFV